MQPSAWRNRPKRGATSAPTAKRIGKGVRKGPVRRSVGLGCGYLRGLSDGFGGRILRSSGVWGSRESTAASTITACMEVAPQADYGAHPPLMAMDGRPWTLDRLLEYAHTAENEGFQAIAANDHLVGVRRPGLGGWRAWATVGWLPPTTPPRKHSRPLAERSQNAFAPSEGTPTGSPTGPPTP